VDIISTEGTQRALAASGIESTEVAAYTGVRELLGGRVKSLHPKVHAGLLGLRDNKLHQEEMNTFGYPWVDLLAVNLHHVEDIVKTPGITVDEVIDQVDIGGIAMIRSAAKNFRYVAVATNPNHYPLLVHEMQAHEGGVSFTTRFRLAQEAFAETARYDRLLAEWLERSEPPKE
jgi:phosphoribosylaminoimidazolecarboxamide formyltransferase/IMP cyclohydrolase